jgi:stage II sporulation protein D
VRIFGIILLTMAVFTVPLNAASETNTLRIGLTRYNTSILQTNSISGCTIVQSDNGDKLVSGKGRFIFELNKSEISIKSDSSNTMTTAHTVRVTSDCPNDLLSISSPDGNDRKYHGVIEISTGNGSLKVVNIVDVEDYLAGVLPKEIGESSPEEALRAQAITARTYAVANRNKHKSQGYDLCDCTHCQMYDGACSEKPRCSKAVSDTNGMILTYNGIAAEVMYSADCGGATVDYKDIRPNANYPYLCSVADPADMSHKEWEQTYTLKDLESKLVSAGIKEASGLQNIKITKTGLANRPLEIAISGTGTTSVTPGKIRTALGMKSTMFTLETSGDGSITFKGKGAGHGIGLCQAGAKALAGVGHNYTYPQILTYFFPGTQISNMDSKPIAAAEKAAIIPKIIKVAEVPVKKMDEKKEVKEVTGTFEVRLHAPDSL